MSNDEVGLALRLVCSLALWCSLQKMVVTWQIKETHLVRCGPKTSIPNYMYPPKYLGNPVAQEERKAGNLPICEDWLLK